MRDRFQQDSIDLRALAQKLFERWYLFVICMGMALLMAFFYIKMSPKVFRVKASMLLMKENTESVIATKILRNLGQNFGGNSELEDEIALLSSFSMIEEAVSNLELGVAYYNKDRFRERQGFRNAPFRIEVDSTHVQAIETKIKVKLRANNEIKLVANAENVNAYDLRKDSLIRQLPAYNLNALVRPGVWYQDENIRVRVTLTGDVQKFEEKEHFFAILTAPRLARMFQSALIVKARNDDAHIIDLEMEGEVIPITKNFLDELMAVFMDREIVLKNRQNQEALAFIEEQLTNIRDSLSRVESEKQRAQGKRGVIDPSATARNLNDQLARLNSQRTDLQTRADYYQYILTNVEGGSKMDDIITPSSAGVRDDFLNKLLANLQELNLEKAELERKTKEGHPRRLDNEIKIRNTQAALVQNVGNSVESSKIALKNLDRQITEVTNQLTSIPETERLFAAKERELEFTSSRYKNLQKSKSDLEIAIKTNTGNKEVIDKAMLVGDGPVKPKKSVILVLAMMLGAGLPILYIFVADFFNTKIVGRGDLEVSTNIPILGFISQYKGKDPKHIVAKKAQDPLAESFRSVRVNMQYLFGGVEKRVIGITSSKSGEGKTFCAINLGAVMAHSGKKTLIIDADLRRPKLASYFDGESKEGLSDFLAGETKSLDKVIHPTPIDNLFMIPAGQHRDNPIDLLSDTPMEDLMERLKKDFDHIILDTPPVGLVSDYVIIKGLTHFNIYVVRHNSTDVHALKMINELYDKKKIEHMGILINDVPNVRKYGYNDGSSYVQKGAMASV